MNPSALQVSKSIGNMIDFLYFFLYNFLQGSEPKEAEQSKTDSKVSWNYDPHSYRLDWIAIVH